MIESIGQLSLNWWISRLELDKTPGTSLVKMDKQPRSGMKLFQARNAKRAVNKLPRRRAGTVDLKFVRCEGPGGGKGRGAN